MAEPISEWLEPSADSETKPPRQDPGRYVCAWRPFSLVTIVGSSAFLGAGYLLARNSHMAGVIAYILVVSMVGVMMSLAATAWGAAISLTESAKCGALYVIFPPYMFYYAATRWRWMSQPSVLFLCGMGLAAVAILTGRQLLNALTGS